MGQFGQERIDPDDLLYIPDAPKRRHVSLSDFELGEELGQGRYGTVFVARDKTSNAILAIKRLNCDEIVKEYVIEQVQREVKIMQTVHHPNILRLYTYFWDDEHIYLVLEYASQGDVFSLLHDQPGKRFDLRTTAKLVAQLCLAVRHMHAHHVLHRDIKPENMLLDSRGSLKLADFGWGVQDPKMNRRTYCGTPEYMPPEILGPEKPTDPIPSYGPEVDNWCIGVFMYECLCGDSPFSASAEGQTPAEEDLARDRRIRKVEYAFPAELSVPQEARDLIGRLLIRDPRRRATIDDILRSPFIRKYFREDAVDLP